MILTGQNWSTGRETLYNVGGRWMNGYGALVKWYWQGKTEVMGEKLSQWHFVKHKSHVEWPGIEPNKSVRTSHSRHRAAAAYNQPVNAVEGNNSWLVWKPHGQTNTHSGQNVAFAVK